jgi:hypothetical protein
MLADPKATRWMNDFVGQWLAVRNIKAHEPDPDIFPEFDDNLRQAMETETELCFESQVREVRDSWSSCVPVTHSSTSGSPGITECRACTEAISDAWP